MCRDANVTRKAQFPIAVLEDDGERAVMIPSQLDGADSVLVLDARVEFACLIRLGILP